jgi:predicted transcriptional regulator
VPGGRNCSRIVRIRPRQPPAISHVSVAVVAIPSFMMQIVSKEIARVNAKRLIHDIFCIVITSDQIRAARALLRWSARELAAKAGLSLPTVQRLEAANGMPSTSVKTLTSIKTALERAGVEFTNGDAPGVRLKRQ